MIVKAFVFGRPGSGKSTATRCIEMGVRDQVKECNVLRFCDYDILYQMFQDDTEQEKFCPTEHEGFDILDLGAFDIALKTLEGRVEKWMEEAFSSQLLAEEDKGLAIIEFARDDYAHALSQFKAEFLEDTFFLFLDVDIDTCIERIRERTARPITADDHYVSPYIFDVYYHKDDKQFMTSHNLASYGIRDENVVVVDNTGPQTVLSEKLDPFIARLCSEVDGTSFSQKSVTSSPEPVVSRAVFKLPVVHWTLDKQAAVELSSHIY